MMKKFEQLLNPLMKVKNTLTNIFFVKCGRNVILVSASNELLAVPVGCC